MEQINQLIFEAFGELNSPETLAMFAKWHCIPTETIKSKCHRVNVLFYEGKNMGYYGELSVNSLLQKEEQAKISDKRGKREFRLDVLLPEERVRFVKNQLVVNGYRIIYLPRVDIRALSPIVVVGIDGQLHETNWNTLQRCILRRTHTEPDRTFLAVRRKNSKRLHEWAKEHKVHITGGYEGANFVYSGLVLEGEFQGYQVEVSWQKICNNTKLQFANLPLQSKKQYIEQLLERNSMVMLDYDLKTGQVTYRNPKGRKLTKSAVTIRSLLPR